MMNTLRTFLFFLIPALAISCTRPPLPPPVVLFDQGHGQQSLIENTGDLGLSRLAEAFKDQTFEVKSSNGPFTAALLKNISTLIISGPIQKIPQDEIQVLIEFLLDGGQMCLMLHISDPVAQLLNSVGVNVSNGVIREQMNLLTPGIPTDFHVDRLASPHPLTQNITQVKFYGPWALNTQLEANVIAKTSPKAWVDLNNNGRRDPGDASQQFNVIITGQVGHGHFTVFADDAIFQNQFINGQNLLLAKNLANWLKKGSYY